MKPKPWTTRNTQGYAKKRETENLKTKHVDKDKSNPKFGVTWVIN